MHHIEIVTTAGVLVGLSSEVTKQDIADIYSEIENGGFRNLEQFTLDTHGGRVVINPAHIVSIAVLEDRTF